MLAAETKVTGSHSERVQEAETGACSRRKRIMEPVEPFLQVWRRNNSCVRPMILTPKS